MSQFGQGEAPRTVEDLLGGGLMAKLDRLDVLSRKVFSGKIHGERRSRRRGQSVDFADYRPYTPGDDLRFVDWNIYARLETLFLKLFLEEEDLSLAIAVDTSPSMDWGGPNKLGFCKRLAMALGYIGPGQSAPSEPVRIRWRGRDALDLAAGSSQNAGNGNVVAGHVARGTWRA